MKVLCISKWAKAPSPEERDAILPKEVPATLKLYLDGVIEQMWFKLDAPGVVFLVNAESVDAAKTHVHGLPLGQRGRAAEVTSVGGRDTARAAFTAAAV